MIGISYGNYNSMIAGQTRYQTAGRSKKSSGEVSFGTKVSDQEHYISAPRDGSWATCPEVDKIPSKYELKDGGAITWNWHQPGIEYRFFHAAESTEENPVLVARGVDEHGKLFEEKIDVRRIDPYNTTSLEMEALSYFKPEGNRFCNPYSLYEGYEFKGMQERFDFIAGARQRIVDCTRLRFSEEAADWKEDIDLILSFTGASARPDRVGNNFKLDAESLSHFARENERNLERYSSAAKERLIYSMAKKCSEELSDMLWEK